MSGTAVVLIIVVLLVLVALGVVVKYVVPGRRLKAAGVPTSTLLLGAALGVVGFFVIPVVGLLVGFVLGVYLAELRRELVRLRHAREATYAVPAQPVAARGQTVAG